MTRLPLSWRPVRWLSLDGVRVDLAAHVQQHWDWLTPDVCPLCREALARGLAETRRAS